MVNLPLGARFLYGTTALSAGQTMPIDSRDAAYGAQPGNFTDTNAYRDHFLSGGTNFNLEQWFTDQGITDPQARTYHNYTRLRGIENRPDVVQYGQRLWKGGVDPYTFTPIGPNRPMEPQNSAGLNLAPNGGQYNDKSISVFQNRSDRTRLKGAAIGDGTDLTQGKQPSNLAQSLTLSRPTLLGSGT